MPLRRRTSQRQAIAGALDQAEGPLAPQEMLQLARRQAPRLGIATVYRTIRNMLGEGTLGIVRIPGEVPRYELRRQDHRHYFRCRRCRGVFALEGCPGNFNAIVPRGFSLEDHELVLYGACRRCRDTGKKSPRRRTQHGQVNSSATTPAGPGRKAAKASASLAPPVRLTGKGRRAVSPVARKDHRL